MTGEHPRQLRSRSGPELYSNLDPKDLFDGHGLNMVNSHIAASELAHKIGHHLDRELQGQ